MLPRFQGFDRCRQVEDRRRRYDDRVDLGRLDYVLPPGYGRADSETAGHIPGFVPVAGPDQVQVRLRDLLKSRKVAIHRDPAGPDQPYSHSLHGKLQTRWGKALFTLLRNRGKSKEEREKSEERRVVYAL
jgi:hypothetical protein